MTQLSTKKTCANCPHCGHLEEALLSERIIPEKCRDCMFGQKTESTVVVKKK